MSRYEPTAAQINASNDAVRAIKALLSIATREATLRGALMDELPHIEANVAHIRALAEQVEREGK